MANITIRLLLLILGLVVILNIVQLAITSKRRTKNHQDWRVAAWDDLDNDIESLKARSGSESTSPVEIETCLNTDITKSPVKPCPKIPPNLGPDFQSPTSLDFLSDLLSGGYHCHEQCQAVHHVAIIVAYSGSKKNLIKYLHYMHPFLMKQQINYQFFVIDYANKSSPLNPGHLLNVGFEEAMKHRTWNCVIFHEPHLVPLDSRNLYRCNWYPKQLVTKIQHDDSSQEYQSGTVPIGALALSPELFERLNGFPNRVPGKEQGYLELYRRMQLNNYTLDTNSPEIGLYKILPGQLNNAEKINNSTTDPFGFDGLRTLGYKVRTIIYQSLYTFIRVDQT